MLVAIDIDELAIIIAETVSGAPRPPGVSVKELLQSPVLCNYRAAAQAAAMFIFETVQAHATSNRESVQ